MREDMQLLKTYWLTGLFLTACIVPAQAFDCAKAQSAVEKAICADPKLKAADDAMTAAYTALRDSIAGSERKGLGASQRKWVKSREDSCGYQQGADLGTCVLGQTNERRLLLAAEPESGPGDGSRTMPVFIQQDADPHHYDVDFTLIKFVKPQSKGETLFNNEVSKIGKAAPLGRQSEAARDDMTYAAYMAMTITYASPKFLSAKTESWENSGGAHGNGGTSGITIDLQRGALMKAGDLFDGKAIATLKADCVKQIFKQKKEKNDGQDFNPADDPNYQEATIVEHLRSMDSWNFWKDKATVTFDAYAIGSYAEGPYSCDFATDKLKKLARPGAVLPE
jgi:uncharacterized protein YecT (DUF1311 family)